MLDGVTLDEARLALVALGDRSLLRRLEDGRYRVEPLVARYVAGLGLEAAHDRAIAVFEGRKLPREAWKVEGDIADYVELVFHYVQVGALRRAFYTVRDGQCSENCLETWLDLRGYRQTLIRVYGEILDAWQDKSDQGYGAMLNSIGNAYRDLGQTQEAIKPYQKCHKIMREIDDRRGEATSLGNLGLAHYSLGKFERAIDLHQKCHKIMREIGDRRGEANSLGNLGLAYYSLGKFERAIDLHQKCHKIMREIGDRRGEANSLGNLGLAYYSLGKFERAIELHQQSLKIKREISDRQGEATSLGNLGLAYGSLRKFERAIGLHQQRNKIAQEIGDRQGEAISLNNLGNAYEQLGKIDSAREHYQAARQLFQALQQQHFVEICDQSLAELERKKSNAFIAWLRQLWRQFRRTLPLLLLRRLFLR